MSSLSRRRSVNERKKRAKDNFRILEGAVPKLFFRRSQAARNERGAHVLLRFALDEQAAKSLRYRQGVLTRISRSDEAQRAAGPPANWPCRTAGEKCAPVGRRTL